MEFEVRIVATNTVIIEADNPDEAAEKALALGEWEKGRETWSKEGWKRRALSRLGHNKLCCHNFEHNTNG